MKLLPLKWLMQIFLSVVICSLIFFPVRADSPTNHSIYLPVIWASGGRAYYLSPHGNDSKSGTSEAEAWATFDRAWPELSPGDTLILLDGVYYQSLNPNVRDGEPDRPITIRAKNDGQAIIDGQYQRIPVQLGPWVGWNRDYYIIEGIVARNSNDSVYEINGSHNILRRVSGYNANTDTNSHVFTITGKHTLLEDCIASGTGRKMAFTWGGESNIIRRCFTNWQHYDSREACGEWPWGEDLELYNSSNSVIENSISYGSPVKTAVSVLGNINSNNGGSPYARNNKILGVMSIRNGLFKDGTFWEWPTTRPQPTQCDVVSKYKQWEGWRLGFGVILWGDQAEVTNTLFQDIFSWGNAGLGFSEIGQSHSSTNMTMNRATILNNGLDLVADAPVGTDVILDQISHYSITNSRIEGTQFQSSGARLQYSYVDGVLMDGSNGQPAQPLWPWPMQDRVLKELGIDVTGEMTEILQNAGVPTGSNLSAPIISPVPAASNPVKNISGATYLSPVTVSMSSSTAGATIRYTTDGSEPDATSPEYTGPFTISATALVKAKAFLNGQTSYSRSVYYQINPGMANQPPTVEAYLLPFVYPKAEIMLPSNKIGLYGLAEDFTLPNGGSNLTTNWSVASGPTGVSFANPNQPRTTATFTNPGTYVLRLSAGDGQLTAMAEVTVIVLPQGGLPVTLPGRIEAEDFKGGGEGVGYHDTTNGNNAQIYRFDGVDLNIAYNEGYGYMIEDIVPGEWTAYDVTIPQAGIYTVSVRVAGAVAGGVFHLELDGANITGPMTIPYTNGGLRIYTTLTKQTPLLPQGQHVLRLVFDQPPPGSTDMIASVNYIEFSH